MTEPAQSRRRRLRIASGVRTAWRGLGIIVLNTIALLVLINAALWFVFLLRDRGPEPPFEIPIRQKYPEVDLTRVYPGYSNAEIDSLLTEEWARTHEYTPLTQHRHRPQAGRYVNVAEQGFRLAGPSHPSWPPSPDALNIFVFGGSTTFGVGLADRESIPARLEQVLRDSTAAPVTVYNFGQGYYYSSQERTQFEELLAGGFVPDMAVFIDGLNDFGMREPAFTGVLTRFMDGETPESGPSPALRIPLIRAVTGVRKHLFPAGRAVMEPARKDATAPDAWHEAALRRYRSNQRMIRAVARTYEIDAIFVWQPVPTYAYDRKNYPFDAGETALDVANGYRLFAQKLAGAPADSSFVWLADIQSQLDGPLYVDGVHYTAAFSHRIAEEIAMRIRNRLTDPLPD